MASMNGLFCILLFGIAVNQSNGNSMHLEKRGLFDLASQAFGSGVAQFGNFVLPKSAMEAGCNSVGLKNTKRGLLDLAGQAFGSGVAQFGSFVLPKSAMEAGCSSVGQYKPGQQQQRPPPTVIYQPIYQPMPMPLPPPPPPVPSTLPPRYEVQQGPQYVPVGDVDDMDMIPF